VRSSQSSSRTASTKPDRADRYAAALDAAPERNPMNDLPPLADTAVVLGARVDDWRAAVREVGRALMRSGSTRLEYADRMLAVIEEFGAYVVVAPGLALAHARPGPDVRREGIAVVTLAKPVPFGHPHNDPVRVIVGLAAVNAEEHVAYVAKLANAFNDGGIVGRIARATSAEQVREILGLTAPTDRHPSPA
jgi:PTS system ascorbate-specific IIA component